jgi:hypothetical protein
MVVPEKPKRKKKKKKAAKAQVDGAEEESEDDDIDDEDDEDIDKTIQKKFPDYKHACHLIEELKKQYPQTGINGEQNIWIIKPA